MVEVTFASAMTMLVLTTSVGVFMLGMTSWLRGQGKIDSEGGSQNAVRIVSKELREARDVTVDGDGMGLSYKLPLNDADGNYVIPITWDNVTRRIELQGTNLVVTKPGNTRIICRGVITTDPLSTGGTVPYKLFTAGAAGTTRSINVMVVSSRSSYKVENAVSRSRETIFLRNIPILTR